MNRRRRTEILIHTNPNLAKSLAEDIIKQYGYKELVAPREGLTMMKVRESAKQSLFYLGEVLVTEAKVMVEGAVGLGIVTGTNDTLAKHLAIVDAAYEADLKECQLWSDRLHEAENTMRAERQKQHAALAATKVRFETMED